MPTSFIRSPPQIFFLSSRKHSGMQFTDSTKCMEHVKENFSNHYIVKNWLLDNPVHHQNHTFYFLDPNNKATNITKLVACIANASQELDKMYDWLVALIKELFLVCIERKLESQSWVTFLNNLGECGTGTE